MLLQVRFSSDNITVTEDQSCSKKRTKRDPSETSSCWASSPSRFFSSLVQLKEENYCIKCNAAAGWKKKKKKLTSMNQKLHSCCSSSDNRRCSGLVDPRAISTATKGLVTRGVPSQQQQDEEETQIRVPLLPFLRSPNQAITKSKALSQNRTTPKNNPKNSESSQREKKMQKTPTLHHFRHNSFKNPTTDASHSNRHTKRTNNRHQPERALVWISKNTQKERVKGKKKNTRQKLPKHNLPTNQKQTTLLLRASKQTCTEWGRGGRWAKPTVALKNFGVLFFFFSVLAGVSDWWGWRESKKASASALASFFFFFYLLTKSVYLLREPKQTKSYKGRKVTQVL